MVTDLGGSWVTRNAEISVRAAEYKNGFGNIVANATTPYAYVDFKVAGVDFGARAIGWQGLVLRLPSFLDYMLEGLVIRIQGHGHASSKWLEELRQAKVLDAFYGLISARKPDAINLTQDFVIGAVSASLLARVETVVRGNLSRLGRSEIYVTWGIGAVFSCAVQLDLYMTLGARDGLPVSRIIPVALSAAAACMATIWAIAHFLWRRETISVLGNAPKLRTLQLWPALITAAAIIATASFAIHVLHLSFWSYSH